MKKTGFLVKNISKGREYYYLRRSFRENKVAKNKNVFSFGSREKALTNFNEWKDDINKMPKNLKEMGYGLEDILSWINHIENK